MCGIWSYICKYGKKPSVRAYESFVKIQHRGPDRSDFIQFNDPWSFLLGFHRLAIRDRSTNGDQPFHFENSERIVYTMCNGEIYDFEKLVEKYQFDMKSSCDCEIIPHIYMNYGARQLVQDTKMGEFALLIIDINKKTNDMTIYCATDPCSVRPLFFSESENGFCFSSELIGLVPDSNATCIRVDQGTLMEFKLSADGKISTVQEKYCTFPSTPFIDQTIEDPFKPEYLNPVLDHLGTVLVRCIERMIPSDRPIGALLSGGFDSSTVVSIISRKLRSEGKTLRTFSIGMPNGTDEPFARQVSEHCRTEHTHFSVEYMELLKTLDISPKIIGTYDITTNRASTPQIVISQKIRETTDIKVLVVGDGSDEVTGGYMEFHNAPSIEEYHQGIYKRVTQIHYYDGLRTDRSIAHAGLEARVPFLQEEFIQEYLKVDARLRMPHNGVEKWLIRKVVERLNVLPESIVWRPKEAFSDAISSKEKSWYQIIQEHYNSTCDLNLSDIKHSEYLTPKTAEQMYYRFVFERFHPPNSFRTVPEFWMPMWNKEATDPSARTLKIYSPRH